MKTAMPLAPVFPILVVDDDPLILKSFEIALKIAGLKNLIICQQPGEVKAILLENKIFTVLLDLNMPGVEGQEILEHIVTEYPDVPVIIITGSNEVQTAVQCMKFGAFDYLVKPVERSRLVSVVRRAIEIRELQYENYQLKQRILGKPLTKADVFAETITNNNGMLSLFQYAESIALSPQPILVVGETGVGKELMAKALHKLSGRPGKCVTVNVAGIDDNAFTDTLFGHVKGAFTGADSMRPGLVEQATDGTLVLDEIGDLSKESQVKLLRLIQEREYFPLGSDMAKATNARIIVSTNQDLQRLQESGQFRKDLFFRLRAHRVEIPPLRHRKDDIPLLLEHFLAEASAALGIKKPKYPAELRHLLDQYSFPGNVRELSAMVYDAVSTLKGKTISLQQFHLHITQGQGQNISDESLPGSPETQAPLQLSGTLPTLKQANQYLILEAMRRSNNNQSMAARLLGISRQTLARHLQNNE